MSEDLKETALKVYTAIFENQDSVEVEGVTYFIEKTSKSKLRSVEIDDLTFIEQNPKKDSKWAQAGKRRQPDHVGDERASVRGPCDGREVPQPEKRVRIAETVIDALIGDLVPRIDARGQAREERIE